MITESIIKIFFAVPHMILNAVPALEAHLPNIDISAITDMLSVTGFLFPVLALMPIIVITIAVNLFQLVWSLIIRVKSFIPTMGA